MKVSEQTLQQIERFLKKIAQKFPTSDEASLVTDIHIVLFQESGELIAFDDDDNEVTRCVVEQWINNTDEQFYHEACTVMRGSCEKMRDTLEGLGIMKPYSLVLENDERATVGELFLADNETIIIGGDLMSGLDEDLENFISKVMKEGMDDMNKVTIAPDEN